ncbi:MAG: TIGR03621 family F420-dependent LLM class oxidoreductase [Ilumatobacteraceae bacterium]|nr:TIGR03621 family F420-dependent LLM class oxidoreductase [Ilumatobacteraceae bacterium]
MDRPYRFAVQGGPFDDVDALVDHARLVESLGYDELFSYDHIGSADSPGATKLVDPFVPLVIAAHSTERLRVGPLVLNNEFHHPALLARTAATVDRMTRGRLVLGLGTGYAEAEHDGIGSPIRPPGPRVSRFGESLTILRSLLDDGSATADGEHEQVHIESLGISPLQPHVPFLIGGHGRRVVALAGRHADIFQFTGLTHGDDGAPSGAGFALDRLVERSRWLEAAAGDRHDDIERSALVQFTHVGSDAPSTGELADRFGLPEEVVADTPFVLLGTVDRIVDQIERYRASLGITHYVVRDPEGFAPVVDALAAGVA